MKLSEAMNEVVSVEKDIKLVEVAKIFAKEGISSIVLINKGKAKGIITERDIIKNIDNLNKKRISQVMSKKLVTIDYDKELEDALDLMKSKKIKRLLIIDEQDTLVGIITATDIIANADFINKAFSFF